MATNNSLVNVSQIAAEALVGMESNLVAANVMYTDKTADFSKVGGYSVGESVSIKTRPSFAVDEFTAGGSVNIQGVNESLTTLTLEKHLDVSVAFGAREQAMSIDNLNDQVILPAVKALADKIDTYLLSKAWQARGMYGSTSLLANASDIALASKNAKEQQIDSAGRIGFVSSALEAKLLGTDVFNRFDIRGDRAPTALAEASMGRLMGIDWISSTNFTDENHVLGDGTAITKNAPTTSENVQGASVLTFNAASVGSFLAGDRILVAGLKRPLIVAADALVGSTSVTLTHPLDEVVDSSAAISVIGSGNTSVDYSGIILDSNSYAYLMPPLPAFIGGDSFVVNANGKSLRVSTQADIKTKEVILSIDCLIGGSAYDPRRAMILGDLNA